MTTTAEDRRTAGDSRTAEEHRLRELPLRERKRLRTRRALIETALARYTRDGFEHTTLDDLTDAVEVSKRTFFRYFSSKEDVALAPEKEFWAACLDVLGDCDLSGPVLDVFRRALITTLERMDETWEHQFARSRHLVETTPALTAASLQYCAETSTAILGLLARRLPPGDADDVRLRIALEITVAAWRCALHDWAAPAATADRAHLIALTDRAFAAVPEAVGHTAAGHGASPGPRHA
ncbi:TetR family transcriptional regulator [Streptomyces clavuligerus]|nr:TetR family transcriptional regulator [Streptomyces clavuligerus]WDN50731.1 TetR family transcriptional regulator [Streptomyces clavuligerus]